LTIIGVDEAGRGPLAGSVVTAAVAFPANFYLEGLTDSKKLTEKKREDLILLKRLNGKAPITELTSVLKLYRVVLI